MALLSSSTGRVLAVLLAAAAAGCALVGAFGGGERPLAFSHRVHVTDQGLDCNDCHRSAQSADDPGMPVQSQCMLCHQEIDAKKPPERGVATLFDGKNYRAAHGNRLAGEVVFSHHKHVATGQQCNACHQGIETNEAILPQPTIRMADCVACHAERHLAAECATCHREIRADRPPPTHAFAWQRLHGKAVRAHGTATADRCTLCHQDSACVGCHMEVPPQNHNNYFRLRGHGVLARMDRDNCAACHRSDSCDICHRDVLPINHAGLWGAPRDNHCLSCHFPLGTTDCATCHRDTPSHATAAPMPGNHTPGMNCRQCHGLTAPLPHVDNGSECTRCHR